MNIFKLNFLIKLKKRAIVMSLEGVIAAIAAWIILNQILDLNNMIGCTLILGGILLSQLAPIYEKNYK